MTIIWHSPFFMHAISWKKSPFWGFFIVHLLWFSIIKTSERTILHAILWLVQNFITLIFYNLNYIKKIFFVLFYDIINLKKRRMNSLSFFTPKVKNLRQQGGSDYRDDLHTIHKISWKARIKNYWFQTSALELNKRWRLKVAWKNLRHLPKHISPMFLMLPSFKEKLVLRT